MTKVLVSPLVTQWLDNATDALDGGLLYTYVGNSTTPTTTWTDSTAGTEQQNPIELDSAGREPGGIWVTPGIAYKFILKTAAGVTIDTIDNVVTGSAETGTGQNYLVHMQFLGIPSVSQVIFGHIFDRAVTLPTNLVGSFLVQDIVDPSSSCVCNMYLNGILFGTLTISTSGVATVSSTVQTTASNDLWTILAPGTATTITDIFGTFTLETA